MRNALSVRLRVWDKEAKNMCPSFPLYKANFFEMETMDNIIVMFGTGLTDKQGVEIYEFDIVRFYDDELKTFRVEEVRWREYGWQVAGTQYFDDKTFEIIGNKFENPELLEE